MNQAQQPEALRLAEKLVEPIKGFPGATKLEAAAAAELRRLHARVQELGALNQEAQETLEFVERWAVHHGTKSSMTAEEALSCIQHYPAIKAITNSYTDGKVPDTFDPFARIADLEGQQKGEPLSYQQIRDAWYDCGIGTAYDIPPSQDEIDWARAIERAHGITAQPEYHADDERDHSDEDAAIAAGKVQAAVQGRTS